MHHVAIPNPSLASRLAASPVILYSPRPRWLDGPSALHPPLTSTGDPQLGKDRKTMLPRLDKLTLAFQDRSRLLTAAFFSVIAGAFLLYTFRANTDLAFGRFALYMDERITFDGVKAIYHPTRLSNFLWAVSDGGDHRYGRSLWIGMAAFSLLPTAIFGDAGQIVAGRMFQALLLIAAALVFSGGLLRSWKLRVVLSCTILTLPYAAYYATMPKPEPLQLFFMASFCVFFVRNRLRFGWYWCLAGLAFGTKISVLPALCILVCAAVAFDLLKTRSGTLLADGTTALVAFCLGLGLAVPILLRPAVVLVTGSLVIAGVEPLRRLSERAQLALMGALFVSCGFFDRASVGRWLDHTFRSTGHGGDQQHINVFSWISFFFDQWIVAPRAIAIALVVACLGCLLLHAWRIWTRAEVDTREIAGVAIALGGLAMNASIVLFVHRLWGLYLYPGTVMLAAGLLLSIDSYVTHPETSIGQGRRLGDWICGVTAGLVGAMAVLFWAPSSIRELTLLSKRSASVEFQEQYQSYRYIVSFLQSLPASTAPIEILYSPSLFPPDNTPNYRIEEFWGPYTRWSQPAAVIILGRKNTPRGAATPDDSPEYTAFLQEREGYRLHVTTTDRRCSALPCYRQHIVLPNGGEILVLETLASGG